MTEKQIERVKLKITNTKKHLQQTKGFGVESITMDKELDT